MVSILFRRFCSFRKNNIWPEGFAHFVWLEQWPEGFAHFVWFGQWPEGFAHFV